MQASLKRGRSVGGLASEVAAAEARLISLLEVSADDFHMMKKLIVYS